MNAPTLNKREPYRYPTILLVDDDSLDRQSMKAVLAKQSYQVIEASDGKHALEVLANHSTQIDLLVTDIQMPVMSGIELAKIIFNSSQPSKVLFISGFRNHLSTEINGQRVDCVEKTIDYVNLTKKIAELLKRTDTDTECFINSMLTLS